MIWLTLLAGIAIGGGFVGIVMRYRGKSQDAQIETLLKAVSLDMPEDPGEEIAEKDLPPLEELFVPVPEKRLTREELIDALGEGRRNPHYATVMVPPEVLAASEAKGDEFVTAEELLKLGVDPADEALDRDLFMMDTPRVEEEA